MKQLTIHIPEAKFDFMLEVLRQFSFLKIDDPLVGAFVISDEQKKLVNDEINKISERTDYLLDWNLVESQVNEE